MRIGQRIRAARLAHEPQISVAKLAHAVGMAPSTLYDLERGDSESTTKLHLIAEFLGVRVLWLETGRGEMREGAVTLLKPDANNLDIPQLDVYASMGPGAHLQDHIDIVRTVTVSLSELRRQVPSFTSPQNLRILTGLGDSMKPTFSDGDPLLVDVGVTEITVDGVYVLEKDDQLFVKRMQRKMLDNSLMMISDNKEYSSEAITNGDRQKFAVRGRVLLAWNAKRL